MAASQYDTNGVLRVRWDDGARLYTEWDANGVQTLQRPFTPEENARADEAAAAEAIESNRRTIEQAAADALDQNRTIITGADDYLAGHITLPASPTNAQILAAVKAYGAQVRALTLAAQWAAQQRQGLIRLALNQLDGTD